MVSALESIIFTNILSMFGNNLFFLALVFLAFSVCLLLVLKLPLQLIIPLISIPFLIIGSVFKEATVFLGLGLGVIIAYAIYSLWVGR